MLTNRSACTGLLILGQYRYSLCLTRLIAFGLTLHSDLHSLRSTSMATYKLQMTNKTEQSVIQPLRSSIDEILFPL